MLVNIGLYIDTIIILKKGMKNAVLNFKKQQKRIKNDLFKIHRHFKYKEERSSQAISLRKLEVIHNQKLAPVKKHLELHQWVKILLP